MIPIFDQLMLQILMEQSFLFPVVSTVIFLKSSFWKAVTAPKGKQSMECFDFWLSMGVSEQASHNLRVPSKEAVKN